MIPLERTQYSQYNFVFDFLTDSSME